MDSAATMKLSLVILLTLLGNPVWASSMAQRCDALAALKADPLRTASPVPYGDLDPRDVIIACKNAVILEEANLERGRFLLQLGRGYLKKGEIDKARAAFKNSSALQYPAAYFALGVMYWLGDDIPKDDHKAEVYLLKAFKLDVIYASKILQQLYSQFNSDSYSVSKTRFYSTQWLKNFETN